MHTPCILKLNCSELERVYGGSGTPIQGRIYGLETASATKHRPSTQEEPCPKRHFQVSYSTDGMNDNLHPKKQCTPRTFKAFERLTQKLMALSNEEINELEAKRVRRRGGGRRPMLKRP